MNSEVICRFNQYGYCKYGNHCFRKHVDKICENGRCSASNCKLRLPRNCKYFFRYRYCKFGQFCRFNHEEIGKKQKSEEIDTLKIDIEKFKQEIDEKDKHINRKESEIQELEKSLGLQGEGRDRFKDKIDDLETRIKDLEKENKELKNNMEEIREENESLNNEIAVNDMLFESFKERMRDKYLYNTEDEESDYESDDDIREKRREIFRRKKAEERFKTNLCQVCDFKAKNAAGLKTHQRMKHKC